MFGADIHRYQLNPLLTAELIQQFELANQVKLPADYVAFLTQVGNGGAGPFYGIHTLAESLIACWDSSDQEKHTYFDLSKPFPHTESWNAEEELEMLYDKMESASEAGDIELEEKLFDEKWELISGEEHDYGRLNVTDYGYGIVISLIVNGEESGNMWTDNRTHDGGIYPSTELGNTDKVSFLNWYELWLDDSIQKIREKLK